MSHTTTNAIPVPHSTAAGSLERTVVTHDRGKFSDITAAAGYPAQMYVARWSPGDASFYWFI